MWGNNLPEEIDMLFCTFLIKVGGFQTKLYLMLDKIFLLHASPLFLSPAVSFETLNPKVDGRCKSSKSYPVLSGEKERSPVLHP